MRHWVSLNVFADETGVEAVWLSLVLQIICVVIFHDGFRNRLGHFGLLVQKSRVVTVATLEGMHAFLQ